MKKFFILALSAMLLYACDGKLSSKLEGKVYEYYSVEIDDGADGLPVETTERITFISETECSVYTFGYDWVYRSSGHKKNSWSNTYTLSYSMEGDIITISKYRRQSNGNHKDIKLRYTGSTLVQIDGERIFYKL